MPFGYLAQIGKFQQQRMNEKKISKKKNNYHNEKYLLVLKIWN